MNFYSYIQILYKIIVFQIITASVILEPNQSLFYFNYLNK